MRGEHIAPFALLPALLGLREITAIRGTLKSCLQVSRRQFRCGPCADLSLTTSVTMPTSKSF